MNRHRNNPADPVLGVFERKMQRELLRHIVSKTMFCPVSGSVLDVRTCVVFVDTDGDPSQVLSQSGWQRLVEVSERNGADAVRILAEQGIFLDRSTVKTPEA